MATQPDRTLGRLGAQREVQRMIDEQWRYGFDVKR
jgi:hypothetical protein